MHFVKTCSVRETSSIILFFPRGLGDGLLPLAIGRPGFDNYLLWRMRSRGAELVDASSAVVAIHQNHDYATAHSDTEIEKGSRNIEESRDDRSVVAPITIDDATQILDADGIHASHRHTWLMAKRLWSHR